MHVCTLNDIRAYIIHTDSTIQNKQANITLKTREMCHDCCFSKSVPFIPDHSQVNLEFKLPNMHCISILVSWYDWIQLGTICKRIRSLPNAEFLVLPFWKLVERQKFFQYPSRHMCWLISKGIQKYMMLAQILMGLSEIVGTLLPDVGFFNVIMKPHPFDSPIFL